MSYVLDHIGGILKPSLKFNEYQYIHQEYNHISLAYIHIHGLTVLEKFELSFKSDEY